ncbi:hypothetical protein KC320_g139 [Hortaea werneckii]|nr:hypothetical protein KC320_g139 [Hortaea werneckii]
MLKLLAERLVVVGVFANIRSPLSGRLGGLFKRDIVFVVILGGLRRFALLLQRHIVFRLAVLFVALTVLRRSLPLTTGSAICEWRLRVNLHIIDWAIDHGNARISLAVLAVAWVLLIHGRVFGLRDGFVGLDSWMREAARADNAYWTSRCEVRLRLSEVQNLTKSHSGEGVDIAKSDAPLRMRLEAMSALRTLQRLIIF